jgi:hypothetical protein
MADGYLRNYVKAHYKRWYEFAEENGSCMNSSIAIVTGYERTDKWAMYASTMRDATVELEIGANIPNAAGASVGCHFKGKKCPWSQQRTGPNAPDVDDGGAVPAPSTPEKPTQCTFFQGYRMKRFLRLGINVNNLRAAAGLHDLPPDKGPDSGDSSLSVGEMSLEDCDNEDEVVDMNDNPEVRCFISIPVSRI